MKNAAKISVVIAFRNESRFIVNAVNSVVLQNYRPIELILVDDGSTDGSAGIVEDLELGDIELVSLRLEGSGSVSAARNAGLRAASGDIISFLDGDDELLTDSLEKRAFYLRENPECDIVIANSKLHLEANVEVPAAYAGQKHGDHFAHFMSMMFPIDILRRVGGFNIDFDIGEDREFPLRAQSIGCRVDVIDSVVYLYRIHGKNIMYSADSSGKTLLRIASYIKRQKDAGCNLRVDLNSGRAE